MFTGIVVGTGAVRRLETVEGAALRLLVDTAVLGHEPGHGESIAVAGTCLTVVSHGEEGTAFDVIGETVRCTTLGDLVVGDPVNLEGSLRVGDPIGGHQVQGHIDGVGVVRRVDRRADETWMDLEAPDAVMRTLVPKGWIAVDGVSLTVAALGDDSFSVALIPTTLDLTTFGRLEVGSRVNLEGDPLGKHVLRWMELRAGQPAPAESEGLVRSF